MQRRRPRPGGADEAVRSELEPVLPRGDDLDERLLARRPLLDRQPPPGRLDLVQRVRDVLRRALRGHGAIVAARVTASGLPWEHAGLPFSSRANGAGPLVVLDGGPSA